MTVKLADSYGQWTANNSIPKLFNNAEPGSILTGKPRKFCRSRPKEIEVTVAGSHLI
jgi:haloalkane dehalogenase